MGDIQGQASGRVGGPAQVEHLTVSNQLIDWNANGRHL